MDLRVRRRRRFRGSSDTVCTFPRPMIGLVAILIVLLAALAAGAVLLPRLLRGELGALQERAASELSARNAEFELRLQGLERTLNTRLAATTQTTTQIHDRLGQMTQATAEMIE